MENELDANFSIVNCIWKRPVVHLSNALACWAGQSKMPLEVIIVDANPDDDESKQVKEVCDRYDFVRWFHFPLGSFQFSRIINYGVRRVSDDADYIFESDVEMMFSSNYLEHVASRMHKNALGCGYCGTLSASVVVPSNPLANWEMLMNSVDPGSAASFSPGTFLCAHRDWWFKIRGWDEVILYSYQDVDIHRRADLSGLEKVKVVWSQAQAIHQWHPPSPLFYAPGGRSLPAIQSDTTIVRNLGMTWGELP